MMQPLTTIFTASSWCLDRFAVFIDSNSFHSSTLSPSRGWVDPSFSRCVPSQYTDRLQTLSPGVCPDYMTIARNVSHIGGGKTIWTGGCCQSGFSDMLGYFCTSTVTTPMGFLLLPNITTTDIYTTLSDLWIEHDQVTVAWQESDLKLLPREVATRYASIMGIALTTTITTESSITTHTTSSASARSSSIVIASSTTPAATSSAHTTPKTTMTGDTATPSTTSKRIASSLSSSSTTSNGESLLPPWTAIPLLTWLACLWVSHYIV
ncbi:hypothetical protein F5Y06DRAFT_144028 [Hypoxylon sp. FL0890]|nr:hypothetical protein F5Y06DRAFT_144028 [Hypoxylon sp. FL0890]